MLRARANWPLTFQNPQSLNRYAYVMNNPMSLLDPQGTCPNPPKGWTLVQASSCTFKPPVCNGMVCADQYYGGQLFEGAGYQAAIGMICVSHGITGYCGQGALESFMSPTGSDEFDINAPPINLGSETNPIYIYSGVDWATDPGAPVTNSSGRTSTSTGTVGFSDVLWTLGTLQHPMADAALMPGSSQEQINAAIAGNYIFLPSPASAASQSPGMALFMGYGTPVLPPVHGFPTSLPPGLPGLWFAGQ